MMVLHRFTGSLLAAVAQAHHEQLGFPGIPRGARVVVGGDEALESLVDLGLLRGAEARPFTRIGRGQRRRHAAPVVGTAARQKALQRLQAFVAAAALALRLIGLVPAVEMLEFCPCGPRRGVENFTGQAVVLQVGMQGIWKIKSQRLRQLREIGNRQHRFAHGFQPQLTPFIAIFQAAYHGVVGEFMPINTLGLAPSNSSPQNAAALRCQTCVEKWLVPQPDLAHL